MITKRVSYPSISFASYSEDGLRPQFVSVNDQLRQRTCNDVRILHFPEGNSVKPLALYWRCTDYSSFTILLILLISSKATHFRLTAQSVATSQSKSAFRTNTASRIPTDRRWWYPERPRHLESFFLHAIEPINHCCLDALDDQERWTIACRVFPRACDLESLTTLFPYALIVFHFPFTSRLLWASSHSMIRLPLLYTESITINKSPDLIIRPRSCHLAYYLEELLHHLCVWMSTYMLKRILTSDRRSPSWLFL